MITFDKVEEALPEARGIAFDTCHKIYVLMDDTQFNLMKTYEYEKLISADDMSADDMLETIKAWFEESCMLRFVSGVETVEGDANNGFFELIAQGESDEDECADCGMGEYDCSCYDEDEDDEEDEEETN
jgi:hypothetical protein